MECYATADILKISIHAPREGGDQNVNHAQYVLHNDFNPRPPRGGRLRASTRQVRLGRISIHAPREGGDKTFPYSYSVP